MQPYKQTQQTKRFFCFKSLFPRNNRSYIFPQSMQWTYYCVMRVYKLGCRLCYWHVLSPGITCLISCTLRGFQTGRGHSWISLLSQSCAALLWRTWAQSAFVQDPAGVPAAHRKLVVINRRIPVVLRDVLIVSRRQRGARGSRAWEGETDTRIETLQFI